MYSKNHHHRRPRAAVAGSSLVPVVTTVTALVAVTAAAVTFTTANVSEVERQHDDTQALYLAEAALSDAIAQLALSQQSGDTVSAWLGTIDEPLQDSTGQRWSGIAENADGSYTITTSGTVGGSQRSIQATLTPPPPGPFDHAMYAGNMSGDPSYSLNLGGTGGQADAVKGDIYSGGDVVIEGDADVSGSIVAGGSVKGADGRSGVRTETPQILEIDYERFHDFDVAALFDSSTRTTDDAGGSADQLPATSPAHFLRRNPSDRTTDTGSTVKDDYFMEDPYETVRTDSKQDGSDAFELSLTADSNNSVFFIDGNLWIHNYKSYSMKILNEGGDPTKVTFVVKGNVYFSDNLFYSDPDNDGVAFIALADEKVEDSGNIYFGDPVFGTMQFAEAVMFAENNFYDNNLDASGSSSVKIRGNMTAGNQVAIERDYEHKDGTVSHTQLQLEFDDRQSSGTIGLPGIPVDQDRSVGYTIAAWSEVPTPEKLELPTSKIRVDADLSIIELDADVNVKEMSAAAAQWRERWEANFGTEWKTETRDGLWGLGSKTSLIDTTLDTVDSTLDTTVDDVTSILR